MNYLIIGGGIAGLYCAYSLNKKHGIKNILIIEQNNYLGGRIKTFRSKEGILELGAGVILEHHKYVLKLVHELGLEKDLLLYKSIKYYINDTKITNINKNGFIEIIQNLKNGLDDKLEYALAMSYSLYRYIERIHGIDVANDLKNQFGFNADFYEQNAIDGINMLLRDIGASYYKLNNGFNQIINKLRNYLIENKIEIQLGVKLKNINKIGNKYECLLNNDTVMANNVILAIPKNALCKINYLSSINNLLNSVISKALMRIYLVFPVNSKVWFDDLQGITVTNTILNQIVVINKKTGVLMVYLIDNSAITFEYLRLRGILESEVMFYLRRIFKAVNIPNPNKVYCMFWHRATHLWRPTVDSKVNSKKIVKPFEDDRIFIVGEAYSKIQQWSEGALISVNNLMSVI